MAKNLSTRKPLYGNKRSHAENATRHAQRTNKQKFTIDGQKVVLTTKEAKTMKKAA